MGLAGAGWGWPVLGWLVPSWLGLAASAWGWLAGAGWRLGAGGCPTNQKKMALEAATDRRKPFNPREMLLRVPQQSGDEIISKSCF